MSKYLQKDEKVGEGEGKADFQDLNQIQKQLDQSVLRFDSQTNEDPEKEIVNDKDDEEVCGKTLLMQM